MTQATKAVAPLLCTCAASDVYISFWKRVKERAGGTRRGGREYGLAIVIWSWRANTNAKANACVKARIAAFKANSFEWFAIIKIVRNNCERISHPASFIPHDVLCIKLWSVCCKSFVFFLLELDLDLVTVIYSNNIKIAIVISLGVSLAVRKNLESSEEPWRCFIRT